MDKIVKGENMIYILGFIVLFYIIYFFVSIFNSEDTLESLYKKYMCIDNSKRMLGSDIAFLGRRYFNLDIKFAKTNGKMTDGYSPKKKVIIMSEEVCDNESIASAAIVAHELGHAVQQKNHSMLFVICTGLKKFTKIFNFLILPMFIIGGIMYFVGFYQDVAYGILIIGIILACINILMNLLEIPLERNASAIGFQFLKDNAIIDKKNYRKVKKLLSVASKTYMAGFFRSLIPFYRR